MFKVLLLLGRGKRLCYRQGECFIPVHKAGSCVSHPALHAQLKPGWEAAPIPIPVFLPRGDLEVIYPELGDVGCTYIPKCHQYRRRISREWGSPRVQYPWAEEVSPELCPVRAAALALCFSVLIKGVA